jgi:hypothetical protein
MRTCNRLTSTVTASAPLLAPWMEHAEAGAGAMLVACRLAGLSALETYYAEVRVGAQFEPTQRAAPR